MHFEQHLCLFEGTYLHGKLQLIKGFYFKHAYDIKKLKYKDIILSLFLMPKIYILLLSSGYVAKLHRLLLKFAT